MVLRDADPLNGVTPKQQSSSRRARRMAERFPQAARLFSVANRGLFRWTGGRLGGKLAGVPIGLLTTTGRRSGRSRTVPVVYLEDGSHYLVVASNSGLDSPPSWYLNLRAHPDAEMQTRTGSERVVARELTDVESREIWPRLVEHNPMWGAYQSCTERPLAVVTLERQQKDKPGAAPNSPA